MKEYSIIKIQYGSNIINVNTYFEKRKTYRITVYPDNEVIAKFPDNVGIFDATKILQSKGVWIYKKMIHFKEVHPIPFNKKYFRGEEYRYLGRQLRLDIVKTQERSVKLIGKEIIVYTDDTYDTKQVRSQLMAWYRNHAIKYLDSRINKWKKTLKKNKIEIPVIKYRRMGKRWGSCMIYRDNQKSPQITLNTELIIAPSYCIDYVILHEFMHLKYCNHGRQFQMMLDKIMPDWRTRKEKLNKIHPIKW